MLHFHKIGLFVLEEIAILIYGYTFYLVPDHGNGMGWTYDIWHTFTFTPIYFFINGFCMGLFLNPKSVKEYLIFFLCSLFAIFMLMELLFVFHNESIFIVLFRIFSVLEYYY